MKLIEINWDPTSRQLRQFAIICLFALPLVGWMWGASPRTIGQLAMLGMLAAIAGMAVPRVVKPLFLAMMIVAAPIGFVIGELAMLVIYFGVFFPFGIAFRILKRDALQLKNVPQHHRGKHFGSPLDSSDDSRAVSCERDQEAPTYWQSKKQPKGVASYYRQS